MKSSPITKLSVCISFIAILVTSCNQAPNAPLQLQAGVNRYVATNGSDTNAGTSASPYRTIQKCGTVSGSGDICNIGAGTYRETVTPNSGVTFQPNGSASVTVSGADVVSGWSVYSGSIYQATITLPVNGFANTGFFANQLFVGGTMQNEARWPNTGSDPLFRTDATAASGTNSTTLVNSSIQNINWTGATAHIRGGQKWTAHTRTISSSSSGSVTLASAGPDCNNLCANQNSQFYLVGKLAALDSAGEWFYDGAQNKIYLWAANNANPSGLTVEAKKRTNAFDLAGKSGVVVKGLSLFAATINTNSASSSATLDGLNANYISHFITMPETDPNCYIYCSHKLDTGIMLIGTGHVLKNSTLRNSAGNGVLVKGTNITVTNNLIENTNYTAGYTSGIFMDGNSLTITNNSIYKTGRDGIQFGSGSSNVSYNRIANFGVLNSDLGGIYTCCAADGTGVRVHHNWIYDSLYNNGGYSHAGVYVDNGNYNFTVDHNVVWNIQGHGIYLHGNGGSSTGNKVYNNTAGKGISKNSINMGNIGSASGTAIFNNIARGNISYGGTNFTAGNNIGSSVNPQFVDAATTNFRLNSNSPAINAGAVFSGFTDGFAGSAPDSGAYENGGTDWIPGCSLTNCRPAVSAPSDPSDSTPPSNGTTFSNPGFESGATAWTTFGTTAVVASDAHSGSNAMRLSGSGSGSESIITGLTAGTAYTLRAWIKNASSSDQTYVGVKDFGYPEASQATTSTAYAQISVNFTMGGSSNSAKIFCYKAAGTGNSFCDDFEIVAGGTPPATAVANPGFESGASSWTSFGTTAVVASDARSGSNSMRLSGSGSGTEQVISGLTASTAYTLRAWVKTGSSSDQTYLGVKDFGSAEINQVTTSTAYTQLSMNFTTGSSSTSAKIFCYKAAGTGNSFCDDFEVVPASASTNVPFSNQSFESGSTSWSGLGTNAVVASDAHAGTNSMRLSGSGSGTERVLTGLIANKSYTLRGWVKTVSSSDQTYIGVKDYGGSEVNQASTSTTYTQISINFTTGGSSTSAKIYCYKAAGTGNSFCDDFTLTQN